MQQRGHKVTILTALPNYPTGKIYSEYTGKQRRQEVLDGLKVIRSWIYPTKSATLLKRFLNYFSFVFSSMARGSRLERQDIIVVESPPLFLGIAGIFLSKWLRAKLIFNVSDLWPDSAVEIGVINSSSPFVTLSKKLEQFCYRKADAITGQSLSIVQTIKERAPEKIVELITNGSDTTLFSPEKRSDTIRSQYDLDRRFVIVYAGLFGIAQGLGQILDAAKQLSNKNIVFLLVGDGPEKEILVERVNNERLTNVIIQEPIAKSEVPALLASMDAAIVPLKTSINGAVPSKIYENMASGLPILFIGDGDGAEIITRERAGIVLKPYDCSSLLTAIDTLYNDSEMREQMGRNGVEAARTKYSREKIAGSFEALMFKLNKGETVPSVIQKVSKDA
jgi:glycosyltransferase involved in cell wall biosynthesis